VDVAVRAGPAPDVPRPRGEHVAEVGADFGGREVHRERTLRRLGGDADAGPVPCLAGDGGFELTDELADAPEVSDECVCAGGAQVVAVRGPVASGGARGDQVAHAVTSLSPYPARCSIGTRSPSSMHTCPVKSCASDAPSRRRASPGSETHAHQRETSALRG